MLGKFFNHLFLNCHEHCARKNSKNIPKPLIGQTKLSKIDNKLFFRCGDHLKVELESSRDKWRQQCDEEIKRRLEEKEAEVERRLKEKNVKEVEKKVKEAEEKVKSLWAADLAKLRQHFQVY